MGIRKTAENRKKVLYLRGDAAVLGDRMKVHFLILLEYECGADGRTDDTKIYTTAATPQPNGIIVAKGMGQVGSRE